MNVGKYYVTQLQWQWALGLAQANPIGGSVASARKALPVHEGFQQPNWLPILGLPVLADAPADLAQNVAGQMRHPDPGEDEKTRVVDDPSQLAGALQGTPANPLVPHRALPRSEERRVGKEGRSRWSPEH